MHVILVTTDTSQECFKNVEPILMRVENRNYKPFLYKGLDHPYGAEQKKRFMQLNTIKDENLLKFIFFLPHMWSNRKDQSTLCYFMNMIHSEHKGSLCQILQDKKLSLSASTVEDHTVD